MMRKVLYCVVIKLPAAVVIINELTSMTARALPWKPAYGIRILVQYLKKIIHYDKTWKQYNDFVFIILEVIIIVTIHNNLLLW